MTDREILKRFFRAVDPMKPLQPAQYVHLYEDSGGFDPVAQMATQVEFAEGQSVQLFSGHRGTGKTTELQRLKRTLEQQGYVVVHCDMEDHLHMSSPIDVVDFLLAATTAIDDAIRQHPKCGLEPANRGIIERIIDFLRNTDVELGEVGLGGDVPAVSAELKLNLKQNPTYKQKLQERVSGHIGALAQEAHRFVAELVDDARKSAGDPDLQLVVLLDSIEHLRGSTSDAGKVMDSVERLFSMHTDKLRLPHLHMVYTVPPWLPLRAQGIAARFGNLTQIPCVQVHNRDGGTNAGGEALLVEVIAQRERNWDKVFGDRERLALLVGASGGYLRDLLRLVQTCLRTVGQAALPLSTDHIQRCIAQVRDHYLPLTRSDAVWLHKIHTTHRLALDDLERLPELARLLENMLVLSYHDGEEWYDVHPLILDAVEDVAGDASS